MPTSRLEAFSDGVIAILITIMVLELHVPHDPGAAALRSLAPVLASYVLSFAYLGIYWNNHHHMLQATTRVNGAILWVNLHLLFWLSLVPFATAWMGENHFATLPTAVYGLVLLLTAIAYSLLQAAIIKEEGPQSRLAVAVGRDWKGKTSTALYAVALAVAFVNRWVALAVYVIVAIVWFVPDRRVESTLAQASHATRLEG